MGTTPLAAPSCTRAHATPSHTRTRWSSKTNELPSSRCSSRCRIEPKLSPSLGRFFSRAARRCWETDWRRRLASARFASASACLRCCAPLSCSRSLRSRLPLFCSLIAFWMRRRSFMMASRAAFSSWLASLGSLGGSGGTTSSAPVAAGAAAAVTEVICMDWLAGRLAKPIGRGCPVPRLGKSTYVRNLMLGVGTLQKQVSSIVR
mmetsp:Transcript_23739/g.70204  ORF Transcript_23739/g.70204 Transcript_23739/m.70204 type:complete len:205 (-) Transcript_23739:46-660(-)